MPEPGETTHSVCCPEAALCPASAARLEQLRTDGVVVVPDVFSPELLARIRGQYEAAWAQLEPALPSLAWKRRRYRNRDTKQMFFVLNELYEDKPVALLEDGSEVIDMGLGRYDFAVGLDDGLLASPELLNAPALDDWLRSSLRNEYDGYAGGLPSLGGNASGGKGGLWHRDGDNLFDVEGIDLMLPSYTFTALIALKDVEPIDGPTDFILGSHRDHLVSLGADTVEKVEAWAKQPEQLSRRLQASMKAGSVTLFNGTVLHRGGVNMRREPRDMLYIVYKSSWWNDDYNSGCEFKDIHQQVRFGAPATQQSRRVPRLGVY